MVDGMLSLAWNSHSSTFCHMLSTVRDAELYSDVTIACDGKFYPAHKLVLSTCSDYFHKMFERTPCKHPVIVIKDVQCKNMEALLNYMYAGVVNVSQSDLAQLIRAAELLEIKGLAVPDEPPCGSKRPGQTRDTSNSSSPSPKRPRQDEERSSNQKEMALVDSSVASSHSSSSSRRGSGVEEHTNSYGMHDKVNPKQTHSEHWQASTDIPSCTRSEQRGIEQGLDPLKPTAGSQNEVTSGGGIKEEEIELESESGAADMGFEYNSLMSDLVGEGEDTKPHLSASTESFNPSLNEESYSVEAAGPSGLQVWPGLSEEGEPVSQGYSGTLPLVSHPGQQPHQIQHMVMVTSDIDAASASTTAGLRSHKMHHCPYCSYAADFNYLLLRHIRTHTGEKPYCCPQCSYRTSRKDSLKQHMCIHAQPSKTE